jgi:antitoxin (DNA-binding transcriptional repressor) of toxin-antitoxin stability system
MTDVTSKTLHEKTGQLLDRARQGERFHVLRQGRAEAFLIPAAQAVDPEWPEIMAAVWKAQKKPGPKRPNPILRERRARNYAARLR